MRNWVKLFLFLSSYSPLFIIIIIRNYSPITFCSISSAHSVFIFLLALLVGLSYVILFITFLLNKKMQGTLVKVNRISSRNADTLNYIVTYLIPFLSFNLNYWKDVISMVLLIFVIAIIYIKTNLIYVNPILNIIGYSIYEVENDYQVEYMLITHRSKIKKGELLNVIELTNGIYLDKGGCNNNGND